MSLAVTAAAEEATAPIPLPHLLLLDLQVVAQAKRQGS
jgi:hypothetical protein